MIFIATLTASLVLFTMLVVSEARELRREIGTLRNKINYLEQREVKNEMIDMVEKAYRHKQRVLRNAQSLRN